jgi:hypothetical protein
MGFFALVGRMLEGVRKALHLILLLIIFGFVLAALHTSVPSVPRSAALVIAPEGELVEQLSSDPLRRALDRLRAARRRKPSCATSSMPSSRRRAIRASS